MLEGIFGNATAERVLLYLENYGEAYGRAIAETFEDVTVSMAQRQLQRFEGAGVLVSRMIGRTRVYTFSSRSPFVEPLRRMLRTALNALPEGELERYFRQRRRPRRGGKPL